MRKTFKYKLYRSKKNRFLDQRINIAASSWNHCIALHRRYYRLYKKSLNKFQLMKHITKLKKLEKHKQWNEVGSQALQDIVERIDKGYKLFFQNQKAGIKSAPPSFCSFRKYKSFTLKQAGWKLIDANRIKIGTRIYTFSKSREIEGSIKTVTIKRDRLGYFYICFSCDIQDSEVQHTKTGKIAGVDFGLRTFLTFNDGSVEKAPLFFKQSSKEVKQANRYLSSKKKGSSNRRKAVMKLFKTHHKIANRRRDYHHKLASRLTKELDYLFIEDLNLKGMQQRWGRKISDLGFSEFVSILKHQAQKNGCTIGEVDRWYPSSKTCSNCGEVNKNLQIKQEVWICNCGTKHHRDVNAAINILREGASSLGLDCVSESQTPAIA